MGRLADLDAVTLDANGTLIGLVDPVPTLKRLLHAHGIERDAGAIRRAFGTEAQAYAGLAAGARDHAAFALVQRECAGVFLGELDAALDPDEFAPSYAEAFEFEVLPGVLETLRFLRRCGLELGVVANFDLTLAGRLDELGLGRLLSSVVTPAEADAAKPEPQIFEFALARLGVTADRTLHVGDGGVDDAGARAAGLHFEWAPLAEAVGRWT